MRVEQGRAQGRVAVTEPVSAPVEPEGSKGPTNYTSEKLRFLLNFQG